jgi:hypothetical protein
MTNKEDQKDMCKHRWSLVAQQMRCDYCGSIYQVK